MSNYINFEMCETINVSEYDANTLATRAIQTLKHIFMHQPVNIDLVDYDKSTNDDGDMKFTTHCRITMNDFQTFKDIEPDNEILAIIEEQRQVTHS